MYRMKIGYFLSKKIKDHILEQLRHAKYYSIILDCTLDVSHTEQMIMVVRFIKIVVDENMFIREYFLRFLFLLPILLVKASHKYCQGVADTRHFFK